MLYLTNHCALVLFVKKLLFQYSFGYFWKTPTAYINHTQFIKQINIFQQICFADATKRNRCSLYNPLDMNFTMAKYLSIITMQSNRKAMAQLQLIEQGSWKAILHKDRICLHCHLLEDDYHMSKVFSY